MMDYVQGDTGDVGNRIAAKSFRSVQAKLVLQCMALNGTRCQHFLHLRWKDIVLIKVPMVMSEEGAMIADEGQDGDTKCEV